MTRPQWVTVILPDRNPLQPSKQPQSHNICTTRQFNFIHPSIQTYIPDQSKHSDFQHTVHIKKLDPRASSIPTKGTEGSIGLDVTAIQATTILPGGIATIPTGLATAFPETSTYE